MKDSSSFMQTKSVACCSVEKEFLVSNSIKLLSIFSMNFCVSHSLSHISCCLSLNVSRSFRTFVLKEHIYLLFSTKMRKFVFLTFLQNFSD